MSAPASDLRLHLDFWRPAITTAIAPHEAHLRGEVPGVDGNGGKVPDLFALLDLRRRAYTPTALDDHPDVSSWALSVLCAGRTVYEAAWAMDRVTDALEHAVVTIGGHESTPLRVEPGAAIGTKSGVASGSITLNYTL